MPFKREKFDPKSYEKGQRLKAKTVNQLIKAAEEQSAFFTPSGLSGEIGQLARLVSRLLIRRVEFTEDLLEDSSALVKLLEWKNGDYGVDDGTEFKVYDGTGESTAAVGDRGYAVLMADRGEWEMLSGGGDRLYWCMLMEDHPGRYTCFDILIGQWCEEEYRFRFDCDAASATYEVGVDLHHTVSAGGQIPEPEKYAQGWFRKMPAAFTDSGYVYVVVSLDCDSDGICSGASEGHDLPCVTGASATDPCAE